MTTQKSTSNGQDVRLLSRLEAISVELDGVNGARDRLYDERRRIVHTLRGRCTHVRLAEACACSVDMIKNILSTPPDP